MAHHQIIWGSTRSFLLRKHFVLHLFGTISNLTVIVKPPAKSFIQKQNPRNIIDQMFIKTGTLCPPSRAVGGRVCAADLPEAWMDRSFRVNGWGVDGCCPFGGGWGEGFHSTPSEIHFGFPFVGPRRRLPQSTLAQGNNNALPKKTEIKTTGFLGDSLHELLHLRTGAERRFPIIPPFAICSKTSPWLRSIEGKRFHSVRGNQLCSTRHTKR